MQRLTFGMVGGGEGSLIGDIHYKGATFDGTCAMVAGCFSRDVEKGKRSGERYGVALERIYTSYQEMAEKEAAREDRIHFVVIVTPNNSHYEVAKTFLEHGFHVMCDKPLTTEQHESEHLQQLAAEKQLLFGVTYTYSGYPMVKQARELIRSGALGDIYHIMAEYPQEWVMQADQPNWRMDPKQGKSCCVADIGVHIAHTVHYVTGLEIDMLCADLQSFGTLMELDNNAQMMIRYTSGATGTYWCSQVAAGTRNGLKFRIFGSEASLEWEQERPDELRFSPKHQPQQLLHRGRDQLHPSAAIFNRLPGGHPEGVYEAFANLYQAYTHDVRARLAGSMDATGDYPRVADGLAGVRFIDKCLESANNGSTWVKMAP